MVRLLVGVYHGSILRSPPRQVLDKATRIIEQMKPGETVGIEATPEELEYYSFLVQAGKCREPEELKQLVLKTAAVPNKIIKDECEGFEKNPNAYWRFLKIVRENNIFCRLVETAGQRGIRIVPLESAAAKKYEQKTQRAAGRSSKQRAELEMRHAYAIGPLREKGMLSRLRRYNPEVAFIGLGHVQHLQKYNQAQLDSLGLHPANLLKIDAPEQAAPRERKSAQKLNQKMRQARKKFMKNPARKLPDSFRK